MIVLLKHTAADVPGGVGRYLTARNIPFRTVELGRGEAIPGVSRDISAVVSFGGHMNVYEEERHPFLRTEPAFIRELVQNDIPFLGICLGAQLLAKAFDASVYMASHKERGWAPLFLNAEGQRDPIFSGVPEQMPVFQSHRDTFDIPQEGVLLATGSEVANQAFRIGTNAYGFQFHIEMDKDTLTQWFRGREGALGFEDQLASIQPGYSQTVAGILSNFFGMSKVQERQ